MSTRYARSMILPSGWMVSQPSTWTGVLFSHASRNSKKGDLVAKHWGPDRKAFCQECRRDPSEALHRGCGDDTVAVWLGTKPLSGAAWQVLIEVVGQRGE